LHPFSYAFLHLFRVHALDEAIDIDRIVPDVERAHRRVVAHPLPVGARGSDDGPRGFAFGQPYMAPGQDDAGGQPLEIPLPWRRQGLVEVVDVENDLPLGCGEAAEVRQMRVAAGLDPDSGGGGGGEIRRHHVRRAAIEREGRLHHPAEPDGYQARHPAGVRFVEQVDQVSPIPWRLPLAVRFARDLVAQRLADGPPLIRCQMPGLVVASAAAGLGRRIGNCSRWVGVELIVLEHLRLRRKPGATINAASSCDRRR
jgi:hypothetical protein